MRTQLAVMAMAMATTIGLPTSGGSSETVALTWTAPAPLSGDGARAVLPDVATAANGDATVIWRQRTAKGGVLMASRRVDGGDWSIPTRVSGLVNGASLHQVAMNKDRAIVVWKSGRRIMMASQARASGWTRPRALSTEAPSSGGIDVAMNGRGDVSVVWSQSAGKGSKETAVVQAVWQQAHRPWSRPSRISGALSRHRFDVAPQVAVDGRGSTTVLWLRPIEDSDDCLTMQTHHQSRAAHWSKPSVVDGGQGCSGPLLAMNGRGDAVAAWDGSPFEGVDPFPVAAVRPAGGHWHLKSFRSILSSGIGGVAIDPAGNATITWDHEDRRGVHVFTASHPVGSRWGPRMAVSPPDGSGASPRIAMGGDGTTTVIWSAFDGHAFVDVHAAQQPPAGSWSEGIPLSSNPPSDPRTGTRVAMDARGHTVVVWSELNGATPVVMVATR